MSSQRITGVTTKCSEVMLKINNRDPHTMPLGELYRLTGGWDGVREALGITMCTLSYKDKCAKIIREHTAIIAARHEALLAAKRSAKRKADEWGKLFF